MTAKSSWVSKSFSFWSDFFEMCSKMDVVSLSPALSPKEILDFPFFLVRLRLDPRAALENVPSEMARPLHPATRIREPGVQTRLVPISVPTSWKSKVWLLPEAV
jgi:hypothetical protein